MFNSTSVEPEPSLLLHQKCGPLLDNILYTIYIYMYSNIIVKL